MDERLAALVGDLTEADSLAATIEQIVRFAQTSIGAEHAGITLIGPDGRGLHSVGQTDELIGEFDELQHELGEGPCVDAAVAGGTVWSADLGNDRRWPRWGPAATDAGLHSLLSMELRARGHRIGALNLYGDRFKQFDEEDAVLARMFAHHAASALAVIRNEEELREALDTRFEIGQAQGILMERFDIDTSQAFNLLRRYSQDHNIKLIDLSRHLIARRELPSAVDGERLSTALRQ
jgi:GAF domain-containing protein